MVNLPNLSKADLIGADIETKDPNLLDLGTGVRRRDGYILGVGIAVKDKSWYFPLNHIDKENNIDNKKFFRWLKGLKKKTFVWANGSYDLDWLQYNNFLPANNIDVLYAAALLDENNRRNLDSVAGKLTGYKKKKSLPEKYAEEKGLKKRDSEDFRKYLYLMPSKIVNDYGRFDAELNLKVWEKQKPLLEKEELIKVFNMECELMPYLMKMKRQGMRIDLNRLEKLRKKYPKRIEDLQLEVDEIAGGKINVNSPKQMKDLFDKYKKYYPTTEKGNPSFTADFLEVNDWEICQKISDLKHLKKILSTYINGFERFIINGRVHCEFNQLLGDKYGTVTGRFSSSRPSLQVIPKRNKEFKKDLRGLFLPEEDHFILRTDYKQEEVLLLLHFGIGRDAEKFRKAFVKNPSIDFHQLCTNIINNYGFDLGRGKVKSINLGKMYGMGLAKLCKQTGMDIESGRKFLEKHRELFPFLQHTFNTAMNCAIRRGYVKTLMGRRRHFPDPSTAYRALNAVIQGSAGDIMKAVMLKCFKNGIFNTLIPHITLHDELVTSLPKTKEGIEAIKEFIYIQENIFKLKVPLTVEVEYGKNWGTLKTWKGKF